jgi:hypothetical protein
MLRMRLPHVYGYAALHSAQLLARQFFLRTLPRLPNGRRCILLFLGLGYGHLPLPDFFFLPGLSLDRTFLARSISLSVHNRTRADRLRPFRASAWQMKTAGHGEATHFSFCSAHAQCGSGIEIALSLARSPTHSTSPAGSMAVGLFRPVWITVTCAVSPVMVSIESRPLEFSATNR